MRSLRLTGIKRGKPFEIEVDGKTVTAYEGETLATVMLAAGMRSFYVDEYGHAPSRLYCNMGVCQQCLVTVDEEANVQACRTLVRPGMKVRTHP